MESRLISTMADVSLSEKRPLSEVQNLPGDRRSPLKSSGRSGSESDNNRDEQVMFNKLVTRAKKLAEEGNVAKALEYNKRALKLHYTEKLAKRIKKMEAYLAQYGEESSEEDGSMEHVGHGFYLYRELYSKLFVHQKEGVLWFWNLHKKKKGGILGDDMGLGKTIQVIAFLSGMFDMDKVSSVLIVMPVSVIPNWEKEFAKWAPGIRVTAYHGNSKKEKERALAKVQRRGGVCLTSYGLVVTSSQQLSQKDGSEFVWDYVILDEGHKIKNPTKTTKGVHAIPAKQRSILTGTPIQNNLRELWALFDFVHQGTLLGTARTFKMEYENPVTRARERDATAGERRLGQEMAQSLKKIIEPYFLRRTKAEVTDKKLTAESMDGSRELTKMPSLGRKNDFVIWLFLTQTQLKIYEDFLSLDSVKELLMTTKSPLVALTVLKKICDHPRLLSTRACSQLGLDGEDKLNDSDDSPSGMECAANKVDQISDDVLIGESGKLIVLADLLDNLKSEGHRCLVFSQSRKMLDIIQKVITNRGHKVMRLDGTVTQLCDRDKRIQKFQNDMSYSVFLLTTQVGGVGLTLTSADRVVIYDPSWNPATDAQAVDRVFRIGQNKNVVIYRLISCASVEEKIYRRQIFKDSITRQATGGSSNPYRYFTKGELRELFTLDEPRFSKTQRQLQDMHGVDRRSDPKLDIHIAWLHTLEIFGLSDHDLMFSQEHADDVDSDAEQGNEKIHSNDYIQHRVQKAQELIQMESSLSSTLQERMGQYPRNCDIENRQAKSRVYTGGFLQPKTQNENRKPKGSSDYENDVPLPVSVDLTVVEDNNDEPIEIDPTPPKIKQEPSSRDTKPNIQGHHPLDKSSPDQKFKVERSPKQIPKRELDDSVVEIVDSPMKIKQKVKVEAMDNEEIQSPSKPINNMSTVNKDLRGDNHDGLNSSTHSSSPHSDALDYESCEELSPEKGAGISGSKDNLSAEIDQVVERIDHNMSITEDLRDSAAAKPLAQKTSKLNMTCENIDDYLPDSDEEMGITDPIHKSNADSDGEIGLTVDRQGKGDSKPKVERTEENLGLSRSITVTPNKKKRPFIIEQEILISPEPASPLLEMKAKRQRNLSSLSSPAQFLSRTLMSCASDTPDEESRSSVSSSGSDKFVEDSPGSRSDSNSKPRKTNLTSRFLVVDSANNTPDLNKTPDKENEDNDDENLIRSKRRRSVCRRNIVIESSDDESNDATSRSTEESPEKSPKDTSLVVGSSDDEVDNNGKEDEQDSRFLDESKTLVSESTVQRSHDDARAVARGGSNEPAAQNGRIEEDNASEGDASEAEEEDAAQDSLVSEEEEMEAGAADDVNKEDTDEEIEKESENSEDGDFIDDSGEENSGEGSEEEEEEETDDNSEDDDDGLEDLSPELRNQFEEFVQTGRSLYMAGQKEEALANILQAIDIYADPNLQALALTLHKELATS